MKYLSLFLIALLPLSVSAKEMTKEEMMKAFTEFGTPGEGHKKLAQMAGTWNTTNKMWETKDGKPEITKGKSTMKMIMGGKFLQQEFKGKAMGQPYQGMGIMGYNNITKKYESIWLDSFGTSMMQNKDVKFDEETNTIIEEGEHTCPISDSKERDYRTELKFVDKNTMLFSMYGEPPTGGDEFKMMEITYKRAK